MKEVHLIIRGKVQGVSFRYHTRKKANKLNIVGFVKNTENSSVYILAQGKENDLKKFIHWCKEGPNLANVKKVDINWVKFGKRFGQFMIRI